MERQQLGRLLKAGTLSHEVEVITASINKAFDPVDFNFKINFDQPAPMNYPLNQLTAYVEYDEAATPEQLSKVEWNEMKFVEF